LSEEEPTERARLPAGPDRPEMNRVMVNSPDGIWFGLGRPATESWSEVRDLARSAGFGDNSGVRAQGTGLGLVSGDGTRPANAPASPGGAGRQPDGSDPGKSPEACARLSEKNSGSSEKRFALLALAQLDLASMIRLIRATLSWRDSIRRHRPLHRPPGGGAVAAPLPGRGGRVTSRGSLIGSCTDRLVRGGPRIRLTRRREADSAATRVAVPAAGRERLIGRKT
jgi:hypothetical protein